MLSTLVIADLRTAIRSLLHSPGLSLLAVIILAVGIGGTTALFSALYAVSFRPLPFGMPGQLVEIYGEDMARSGMRIPAALLSAVEKRARTIHAVSIHGPVRGVMKTEGGLLALTGERVSSNFCELLGVQPLLGRCFTSKEGDGDGVPVLISSYNFWQQHLDGDRAALGRVVDLDGTPYTVVGVMPAFFRTSFRGTEKAYWTSYATPSIRLLEERVGYEVMGRLRPGTTIGEARNELRDVALQAGLPDWGAGAKRLTLSPLIDDVVGDSAVGLELLLAATVVLLMIVCANLAQLLLARSGQRLAQFAVRQALGATPVSLFRLALLESLLLAAVGGAAGVGLAYILLPMVLAFAPPDIPRLTEATIDWHVLAVAGLTVFLTGCGFGAVPSARLSRSSNVHALASSPHRVSGSTSFLSFLLMGQIAASASLLCLAVLLVHSLATAWPSEIGQALRTRLVFPLAVSSDVFSTPEDRNRGLALLRQNVAGVQGVEDAALASNVAFSGEDLFAPIRITASTSEPIRADVRAVSHNFFNVVALPVVKGRAFIDGDGTSGRGVAVVNDALARRLSADGNLLGTRITVGGSALLSEYEVVGITANARSSADSTDVWNEVYIPFSQSRTSVMYVVLRSNRTPASIGHDIRRAIQAAIPGLPVRSDFAVRSTADLVKEAMTRRAFGSVLMLSFAVAATFVAAIGVFGLVTYSLSLREKEFGVRLALGASPLGLGIQCVSGALRVAGLGLLCASIGTAVLFRLLRSVLFGVDGAPYATFLVAAALLAVVSAVAAGIPALRIRRMDPTLLLRR